MPPAQDAVVHRRQLRVELRRLRDKRGYAQKDVAEAMDWSLSKLNRIESGDVGIATNDLRALLQHYGVNDNAEVSRFVEMARASKEPEAWWAAYSKTTSQTYLKFVSYESAASSIQQFEPLLIPGLLQEEEYAEAVLRAYATTATPKQITDWIDLRMRRQQEVFERAEQPEMLFVLDEATLHRWVGGRDVMRRQLQRLKREAQRDNVTIEVVPFAAGAHAGMKGPFVILEFADYADEVLYLENSRGSMMSRDSEEEMSQCRKALRQLREAAERADLNILIDKALAQMAAPDGSDDRVAGDMAAADTAAADTAAADTAAADKRVPVKQGARARA